MPFPSDAREFFHLVFLERLLGGSGADLYVLKGGVNLRFFFQSPRYSEDMDIDVRSNRVAVETLRKNGYKIVDDPTFCRVLATRGITELRTGDRGKAKQTGTTQRFRIQLVLATGETLPTKVEFSRRGIAQDDVRVERIDPEVAYRHGRTAYPCAHYGGRGMVRQKLRALAERPLPQARDVFDLYLLDSRGEVTPDALASLDRRLFDRAAENVASLSRADYRNQVVEFLDEFGRRDFSPERFDVMKSRVLECIDLARELER